jgi:hypothetical protein
VNTTANNKFSHERRSAVDFRNAEPIVFMERGVEFFVFADGQFDFNTDHLVTICIINQAKCKPYISANVCQKSKFWSKGRA